MDYFQSKYRFDRMGKAGRGIAMAAAHRRAQETCEGEEDREGRADPMPRAGTRRRPGGSEPRRERLSATDAPRRPVRRIQGADG